MKMQKPNESITFNTINWLHIHIHMYADKCRERKRERERERERETGVAVLCDFSHHIIIMITHFISICLV